MAYEYDLDEKYCELENNKRGNPKEETITIIISNLIPKFHRKLSRQFLSVNISFPWT